MINILDIAYWDGTKVMTISFDKWNKDLGAPIGVVIIPEGFTKDGKARIVSLNNTTTEMLPWGHHKTDINPFFKGNDAYEDFDGFNKTQNMKNTDFQYVAAASAWEYKDGVSNLQWYLPSLGEIFMTRFRYTELNKIIETLNGTILDYFPDKFPHVGYWSSTMNTFYSAYAIAGDFVNTFLIPQQDAFVRPFAILE